MKRAWWLFMLLQVGALAQAPDCVNCAVTSPASLTVMDTSKIPVLPDLVTIETPVLERNERATYCMRDENVVDTIVFHHSATDAQDSIEQLNDRHLDRGNARDPWYMLAYHYTISSPYAGHIVPRQRVNQGRPFGMVGSHAGTDIYKPTDVETRRLLAQRKAIICNDQGGNRWTPAPSAYRLRGSSARANLNTLGVLIIGNYAPVSVSNFDGYPVGEARYPTDKTIDLAGRLACQIQRQHPRVVNMRTHDYYHPTLCPGTIAQRMQQIKEAAGRYGCRFN